jgi:hypothetical protein
MFKLIFTFAALAIARRFDIDWWPAWILAIFAGAFGQWLGEEVTNPFPNFRHPADKD